ncbi:hypothetical protein HOLleu_37866 [Holothuria leucospilota]|uniref:Uncharacterized protein n=1 Tax=Holothuria leucospilota TaxID=206669 RepID=A0A9Q0YK33_HOLLE|nr:hypothetical protein HOLleu_37866 [Holothuria leucospilota]
MISQSFQDHVQLKICLQHSQEPTQTLHIKCPTTNYQSSTVPLSMVPAATTKWRKMTLIGLDTKVQRLQVVLVHQVITQLEQDTICTWKLLLFRTIRQPDWLHPLKMQPTIRDFVFLSSIICMATTLILCLSSFLREEMKNLFLEDHRIKVTRGGGQQLKFDRLRYGGVLIPLAWQTDLSCRQLKPPARRTLTRLKHRQLDRQCSDTLRALIPSADCLECADTSTDYPSRALALSGLTA